MSSEVIKNLSEILVQAIAFLAFLWVLKKFAWGPVMDVLEERRDRIAADLDRAKGTNREAEDLKTSYQSKMDGVQEEARQLRLNEINRGKEIAERMVADSKASIAQERENLEQQLVVEMAKAKVELRDFVVDLTIQASTKLIHRSLDDEAHRSLVDDYISQVSQIQN